MRLWLYELSSNLLLFCRKVVGDSAIMILNDSLNWRGRAIGFSENKSFRDRWHSRSSLSFCFMNSIIVLFLKSLKRLSVQCSVLQSLLVNFDEISVGDRFLTRLMKIPRTCDFRLDKLTDIRSFVILFVFLAKCMLF